MANLKSSLKAIKVSAKKAKEHHELKKRIKNLIRDCQISIDQENKPKAIFYFQALQKCVDRAEKKKLVRKNTARRQKARLNAKIKNMK